MVFKMKKFFNFVVVAGLVLTLFPQVSNAQELNLKKYYDAIDRMNGKGAIAVEKSKRDYVGDMPFSEYYKYKLVAGYGDRNNLVSTFLDEKFVFIPELREEKISQLRQYEEGKARRRPEGFINCSDAAINDFKSMLPTDTFGLCIDEWKPRMGRSLKQPLFINLRTGRLCLLHEFGLNNILESTTYLAKKSSFPDFKYEPSYSLTELFKYEWYYPENPEKMCEALKGLEVYRTDINDYDVITSVKVRRSDNMNGGPAQLIYDVECEKGKFVNNHRWEWDFFSIKWYEQLKKCIGMKVIYCSDGEERLLYKDWISALPTWTLKSIELGNLGEKSDSRPALIATICSGQRTKRLDAVHSCLFLTHGKLKLSPKDNSRYRGRLLSYKYVEEHSTKMPESVKNELTWFAKMYTESMVQSLREIWVGQNVSLFLVEFPKAKMIKNTVSGGKAVRIYHANGNEYVFKDGICTSVTKK